jgi:hypothetical protein
MKMDGKSKFPYMKTGKEEAMDYGKKPKAKKPVKKKK